MVGDSVGSVVTQITLILGLLPFFGGKFEVGRYRAGIISILTILTLAIGAVLVADGFLSRLDAAQVGAGAGATVKALTELAMVFGAPEYLISFFGSSIGTSLPELVVDIRRCGAGSAIWPSGM